MRTSFYIACLTLGLILAVNSHGQPVLSIDFNRRNADPATNTQGGFSSFIINSNISNAAIQTQATTRVFGSISVTVSNSEPNGYIDRLRAVPNDTATFTEGLLLRDFVFSGDVNGLGGLDVTVDGLTASQFYKTTIWSYDNSSAGTRVSDWFANGALVLQNYTFNGSVLPTNNSQYRFTFIVQASASGQILIVGRRKANSVDGNNAASFGVFLNALQLEPTMPAPVITTQPVSGTRNLGDRIRFSVVADGVTPFSYQWSKGGMEIAGATAASLTLANLAVADSGDYTVKVTNPFGMATSTAATLTVVPDPPVDVPQGLVSYWPLNDINTDDLGRVFTPDLYSRNDFTLITAGFFDLTPGVFGDGIVFNGTEQLGVRSAGFPIYNNPAFTVALWVNATGTGQSNRFCFAESSTNNATPLFGFGTHSIGANGALRVFIRSDANTVLVDRNSTRTVLDGTWHHVVWTETNGLAKLYIDGALDETDFTYTHSPLTLNQTALAAIVRATVGSFFGGSLDDVAVWNRVLTFTEIQRIRADSVPPPIQLIPPTITQPPASQSVLTQSRVTFTFTATGTSPLAAQWRKNGADLSGETNTVLVLNNVTLGDSGDYAVVVTNSAGGATSQVATLTVTLRPPPPAVLTVDFNNLDPDNTPANTETGFSSFALMAFGPGPVTRSFGGADVTLTGVGVNLESRKRATPVNGGAFTKERLFQDFIFARDTTPATGMDIALEFLEPRQPYDGVIWSFDSTSTGSRISDWSANGASIISAYAFDGATLPTTDDQYRFAFSATSDASGKILIQGRRNAGSAGVFNVFINALQLTRRDLRIQSIEFFSPDSLRLTILMRDPLLTHRVDQKTNLTDADWTEVPDVFYDDPVGLVLRVIFPIPDTATRFYRVVEVQ